MRNLVSLKIIGLLLMLTFISTACSDDVDNLVTDGDTASEMENEMDLPETDGDIDSEKYLSEDEIESADTVEEIESDNFESIEDMEEENNHGWPGCDDRLPTQKLTFLHINDLHSEYSAFSEDQYGSNVARIMGYVKQVRDENPFTVFTNGGDDHEKGSVAEQLSSGYSTVDVVKAMKFDVRVIGNHDFAWGEEELLEFSRDSYAKVLASNTTYIGGNPSDFGAVKYAELQVGCVLVGFMGMVSKPWNEKNQQYDGDFYPEGNFHTTYNYAEIAESVIAQHRDSVDLMVMVSHLGLGDDKLLAEQVNGIDVILGGHSHTIMYEPEIVNNTIILQAGSDGLFVGRLDLEINTVNGGISSHEYNLEMNLPLSMPLDVEFQETVLGIMEKWASGAFDPVTYVHKNRDYDEVGLITCKAVIETLNVDAALLDKGEIWEKWIQGGMSKQDMLDSFQVERQPAGTCGFNSFYTTDINGADLVRIRDEMNIEWSFVCPETIDDSSTYRLALQKHAAYNPSEYLPEGVNIGEIKEEDESWRILDRYVSKRTENCLYLDDDESLPDCSKY